MGTFEQPLSLDCTVNESYWKSQGTKILCFMGIEMNHFDIQNFIFIFILAEITYQI